MDRKKLTFKLIGVLILIISVSACNTDDEFDQIQKVKNFTTNGLTLLERVHSDLDSDSSKESVELYTSAEIASDGRMGWDTGHQWVLLVRKDEDTFPLFNDYVQYGEVQFWIISSNNNNIVGPESVDLERQIYVTVTTDMDMRLISYSWDENSLSYKKEVLLNPPNQWGVIHSNKHSIPAPSRIESN